MNKIALFGYKGYIGSATLKMIATHYPIVAKELNSYALYEPKKSSNGKLSGREFELKEELNINCSSTNESAWEKIYSCNVAIICVNTPGGKYGRLDISTVEEIVSKVSAETIIIKSTLPVGTVDMLEKKYGKDICFMPEFIGQSSYFVPKDLSGFDTDMKECPFVILGGRKEVLKKVMSLIKPILGPMKNYFQHDAKIAEMIKLAENTLFAAKVSMWQQLYDVCNALRIDYDIVREGLFLDPRHGSKMHTAVFEDNRGWNSFCYNKDAPQLIRSSIENGFIPRLFLEVLKSNAEITSVEEVKRLPDLFKDIR
jgi:UDP-glucose 6-dehydrogenase